MCSIGEDDFGDEGAAHAMVAESLPSGIVLSPGDCNKCGVTSSELYKLNFRTAECRDCFLAYARHKFRAALGAAKILPRNAEVLLVLDGSAESLVLLDMLHFAQTQNTFKRLHCNARVVYVDDHQVLGRYPVDMEAIKTLSDQYAPFEFHVIELGALSSSLQRIKEHSPSPNETNELVEKLERLRSLTARQDFLQQQRKNLIASVAEKLQCSHVFEPSISVDLATQLLTAIALGRGGSAALDVALLDDRLAGDVKLLRPLKDLNEQEIQFYVHAQRLKPLLQGGSRYGQERGQTASLQNLTSAFVANLQKNYASTVSTVFRTGDKIAVNAHPEQATCVQCQSALDSDLSDTLLAIEYSRSVSEAGVGLYKNGDDLEALAKRRLEAQDGLCHACRGIQTELRSGKLL
ncbi:cytoplasmic tRNA 2-thiolation protein 2 isoform X1 [Drosophila elegans]|uniref:cytoplasmic tRNA 2-thiolation protein 2 isoform X1 n=1 Tax=Drosophila elegans TaxID=30023 RepID=UPI0007E6B388|nr:cytoplasmic tRNA 2-thiolation protein 2 isoform X1 [Drosophila elegans]